MDFYARFRTAELMFGLGDYRASIRELTSILAELADRDDHLHGLTQVQELLARSYYHSAQLGRAESTARELLADEPDNAYAALLLARSLQRQSRKDEAASAFRLARALGAPDTDRQIVPAS